MNEDGAWSNDAARDDWRDWRKTSLSATLSTINPTQTDLRLNLGLCSDRTVTNYLGCHMTFLFFISVREQWNFWKNVWSADTSYSICLIFRKETFSLAQSVCIQITDRIKAKLRFQHERFTITGDGCYFIFWGIC